MPNLMLDQEKKGLLAIITTLEDYSGRNLLKFFKRAFKDEFVLDINKPKLEKLKKIIEDSNWAAFDDEVFKPANTIVIDGYYLLYNKTKQLAGQFKEVTNELEFAEIKPRNP